MTSLRRSGRMWTYLLHWAGVAAWFLIFAVLSLLGPMLSP